MKTNEIITGLRNCVTTQFTGCKDCPAYCRSANCLNRLHTAAADTLEAQQKRIEELETELKDERHRHDRYVDFELAQAKELEQLRAERDAAINDLRRLACDACRYEALVYIEEPCASCRFAGAGEDKWEWRGATDRKEENS